MPKRILKPRPRRNPRKTLTDLPEDFCEDTKSAGADERSTTGHYQCDAHRTSNTLRPDRNGSDKSLGGGSSRSGDSALTGGVRFNDQSAPDNITSGADENEESWGEPDPFYLGPIPKQRHRRSGRTVLASYYPDEIPFVWVPIDITRLTGGGNAAILLARLVYWYSPGLGSVPRMKPAFCDTRSGWSPGAREILKQTGLNKAKARRAKETLLKQGLIEIGDADANPCEEGDPHVWYRDRILLPEQLAELIDDGGLLTANGVRRPGVKVTVPEVLITSTGNQAIVLAAILRWFEPNANGKSKLRVFRDGHAWRANSHNQLSRETGLSCHQVKRALSGLKKAGFIITAYFYFAEKGQRPARTLHVRPNKQALKKAWEIAVTSLRSGRRPKPQYDHE